MNDGAWGRVGTSLCLQRSLPFGSSWRNESCVSCPVRRRCSELSPLIGLSSALPSYVLLFQFNALGHTWGLHRPLCPAHECHQCQGQRVDEEGRKGTGSGPHPMDSPIHHWRPDPSAVWRVPPLPALLVWSPELLWGSAEGLTCIWAFLHPSTQPPQWNFLLKPVSHACGLLSEHPSSSQSCRLLKVCLSPTRIVIAALGRLSNLIYSSQPYLLTSIIPFTHEMIVVQRARIAQ